jgi:outer membrane lipoprotein-sorting protein
VNPLAVLPLLLAVQDLPPALERARLAYDGLTTLRAEFTQTIVNPMLGEPAVTTGTLWLAPPARFAMRFANGDRLVADGEYFWAWTPSTVEDQVIRQPIPVSGPLTPNLFDQFVRAPAERYAITVLDSDSLRLEPRDAQAAGFRRADLVIDARGFIHWLLLVELSGQRRTLTFRDIAPGAAVPPDEVRFVVPRGVRVVGG